MFERFGSLPLHVLVIHLAVVVLPVSALTAIAFAVLPKWRWLLRWPALVLGLGVLVFAVLVVIAFLLLSGPTALASGKGAKATTSRPLELVVTAAVVVLGVVV